MSKRIPPAEPPRLRSGRPARYWAVRQALCFFGVGGLSPLMGVGLLIGPPWKDPIIFGTLVLILLLCAYGLIVTVRKGQSERRDRDAGYTTLVAPRNRDLWQLDAKTGAVRRRPGEPR